MSQFACYTPYGEAIVDEHLTTYENLFKFSGKELDDITGLYDHGAQSRNPIIDPLFEKYPDFSPYNYCKGNPVKFINSDGREGIVVSGSPGNHNNRTHFLENGFNRAILAKKILKSRKWKCYMANI